MDVAALATGALMLSDTRLFLHGIKFRSSSLVAADPLAKRKRNK